MIVLRLVENPTTGYRWEIERASEAILDQEGDSFELAPAATFGTGGHREFRFLAKSPGSGEIALKHWQPWEGDRSTTERFAVSITVTA